MQESLIPVLTEELNPETKLSLPKMMMALYVAFIGAEFKRQELEEYGYSVGRKMQDISGKGPIITYTFPSVPGLPTYDNIIIERDNIFNVRDNLHNVLTEIINQLKIQRKIAQAKALLTQSLTPQQLDALRQLANDELIKAIKE